MDILPITVYSQETAAEQPVDANDEPLGNLVVPPPATNIDHEVERDDGYREVLHCPQMKLLLCPHKGYFAVRPSCCCGRRGGIFCRKSGWLSWFKMVYPELIVIWQPLEGGGRDNCCRSQKGHGPSK